MSSINLQAEFTLKETCYYSLNKIGYICAIQHVKKKKNCYGMTLIQKKTKVFKKMDTYQLIVS